MKKAWALVVVLTACRSLALARTPTRFSDDFSAYNEGAAFNEGGTFGGWRVEFLGFGAVRVADGTLELIPAQATSANVTHSVLVVGPSLTAPMTLDVNLFTGAQLRIGSAPNPWEAGWVMWGYSDPRHSYYFLPKPNGWELAKRDPAYPGGQRILVTGANRVFRVNQWYHVRVEQRGNDIVVDVDGSEVARFTDTERPYLAGRIALYTEDAAVRFDDVRVR